jgi:hypothetical protein
MIFSSIGKIIFLDRLLSLALVAGTGAESPEKRFAYASRRE